jgi:mannose-6-phosphate isomerase-like protein (cupin superfamily)
MAIVISASRMFARYAVTVPLPTVRRRRLPSFTPPAKLAQFQELWSPKAVGQVNDFHVKLVKLKGEFVWHSHEVEDELFLVLHGTLRMQFRDREVVVEQGEFIIVPHQTEHRPVADAEVHVLLLEPMSTVNTGTAGGERTREVELI